MSINLNHLSQSAPSPKMCSLSLFTPITPHSTSPSLLSPSPLSLPHLPHLSNSPFFPHLKSKRKSLTLSLCKSLDSDEEAEAEEEEEEDEWVKRLPEKKKPLYAHSLPCIEAWLRQLGFRQTGEDPAAWAVEKGDWRANLNLDVTDLYIRYLKTGPGNLEKDVERRFSYALSREDIENAILGGP